MNQRLKGIFYAYRFLSDFMPIYALYALLFQSRGVSESGISILFIVLSLTILFLELPTGAFADLIDRRIVLILSAVAKAIGFFMWFLWPNLIGFTGGMMMWGLGVSLESGCWQAFIYEELAGKGRADEFRSLLARLMGISFIATLISGIIGSALFRIFQNYSIILLISAAAALLAAFIPLLFPKAPHRERTRLPSLREHTLEAVKTWKRSAKVRWLVVIAAFLGGIKGSLDEYHGLLLAEKMVPIEIVPLFYAAFTLIGAAIFFTVSRSHLLPEASRLAGLMLLVGMLIVSVTWLPVWLAIAVLLAMNAIDSLARVDNEALLQASIDSSATRATISSASSFSLQIVSIAVFSISAVVSSHFSFTMLYLLWGGALIFIAVYQWKRAHAKLLFS